MQHSDVISFFEQKYPRNIRDLKYDEYNTGLVFGNQSDANTGVFVTFECSLEAIENAVRQGANLIICHHTPFFKPIGTFEYSKYEVKVLEQLFKYKMTVYVSHTSVDRAKLADNMSAMIAYALDFEPKKILDEDENGYGYGVRASFLQSITSKQLLAYLNDKGYGTRNNGVKLSNVSEIAIIGGATGSMWKIAKRHGVNVLLCGDLTYHDALDAKRENVLLIDIGHESEAVFSSMIGMWLATHVSNCTWDTSVETVIVEG